VKHKIEIFSAGCATCKETIDSVKKLAGSEHEIQVHDMHQHEAPARPSSTACAACQPL